MTWTYTSTDPGGTAKDWIRLRLGDTSSGDQLLQDEEITAFVTQYGNKYLAGARAAEAVAAKFARRANKTVGRLSIAQGSLHAHYLAIAKELRSEAALGAQPYAGGISEADKLAVERDADRVQPRFYSGQFDEPGSVDADSSTAW